jgi:hypothetical protein
VVFTAITVTDSRRIGLAISVSAAQFGLHGEKHSSPSGSPGLKKRAWGTRHHQKHPPEHRCRNAATRQWRLSKCVQEQVCQLVRQLAALDGPAASVGPCGAAGRCGGAQTGRACRLRVVAVLPDGDRLPFSRPELFPTWKFPSGPVSRQNRTGFPSVLEVRCLEDVFKKGKLQKKQSLCLFASMRPRHFRDARAHRRPQR